MKTSDSIKNITEALIKAHAEIKHAIKDKVNPHFRSQYATLESVIDSSKQVLLNNGIVVVQGSNRDGFLITKLIHSSGEFFESELSLMLDKQNMQSLGSAMSYARRYSLAAMLNMAQVDDDAEQSVQNQSKNQEPKKQAQEPKQETSKTPLTNAGKVINYGKSLGFDEFSIKLFATEWSGMPVDLNTLNNDQCRSLCEYMKAKKEG